MPIDLPAAAALPILFVAALWAGVQNQLAGGGSFITLPALMFVGMDARAANITSTVALFPGQITGGWVARKHAAGAGPLSLRALVIISLAGGAIGAVLLLLTPTSFFDRLIPWLILFATIAFAWGSFAPKRATPAAAAPPHPVWAGFGQLLIATYGGYFGGGIGFLMMAAFALAGMAVRSAAATKNILAGVINLTAVAIFLFSGEIRWLAAAVAGSGARLGSYIGAHSVQRINERLLRALVVVIGAALTVAMVVRAYA